MTIATASEIAYAALAARRVCFRTTCPPSNSVGLSSLSLRARFRSTRGPPLDETEQYRGQQRQCRNAEGCADDAGKAITRLVDDDLAEPAAAGDCGDRRCRDHEDRGDPDARDHKRKAERELDVEEDLRLGEAHSSRRLDDVTVDARDPEVRVGEDRRDREHGECGGVVPEAD